MERPDLAERPNLAERPDLKVRPHGGIGPRDPIRPWRPVPRGARPLGRAHPRKVGRFLSDMFGAPGTRVARRMGMRMSRLPREAAYIGANRYFVTINVWNRQPRFTNRQLVETCWKHVDAACESNAFLVIADGYMPDHLHLVVEGLTGGSDFCRFMKDAKQRTSYHAVRTGWRSALAGRLSRSDRATRRGARAVHRLHRSEPGPRRTCGACLGLPVRPRSFCPRPVHP